MQVEAISAVVTGAASGLGAAAAGLLADGGATVLGLDLPTSIENAVLRDGVRLVAADVTSEDEVGAALASVAARRPLRVVINCAGIGHARRILSSRGLHELDLFRRTLEVNTLGTFNVMRLAAEVIAATEPGESGQRGVIINTASVAAYDGQIGQIAYSASKGAIVGMTLPAARDLARYGIRVNTIAPGIVNTPLLAALGPEVTESLAANIPFPQRLARPDEFAQLALMLIEHDYMNGEVVRMDGALRMPPA